MDFWAPKTYLSSGCRASVKPGGMNFTMMLSSTAFSRTSCVSVLNMNQESRVADHYLHSTPGSSRDIGKMSPTSSSRWAVIRKMFSNIAELASFNSLGFSGGIFVRENLDF
jgi:hypothetical protein